MFTKGHVDKLTEGVQAWNDWRRDNPDVVPDLSEFNLGGSDVTDADFRQANLRGAQLSNVVGLLPANLAGADLTRAKLPAELSGFPALAHVAEVSRHARVNFLAVVASCVFCWLTIAQTSDAALIANRGVMPLPVINTEVPIAGFFLFAPAILLALYVYLQLYMQRMWDGLSQLPAIFPDGARLDQKAFPWLLSGLISVYVPRLRKGAPPFAWPQVLLSLVAAWLLVPTTIAWFWLRYLLVTDELGIAPHVVLLALAIAFGVMFYRRAHVTLRGREPSPGPARFVGWLPAPRIVAPLMVLVASLGASVTATYGLRLSTTYWHLDFTGEEITGKANLDSDSIQKLKPLDLRRADFRHAKGRKAILVKVDLRDADLAFSQFHDADLRSADLQGADLTEARLVGANLEGAILARTILNGADLTGASPLTEAMLARACGDGGKLPSFVKPCESSGVQVASAGIELLRALRQLLPFEKKEISPPESPGKPRTQPTETQVAVGVEGKRPGESFRDCPECPEMVVIPVGEFVMGSAEDEKGRFADEGPQHGVKIAAPFAIGKFEVTFAEWDACVSSGPCWPKVRDLWGRDKRPVIGVSTNDAETYINWLNSKVDGSPYRLPSESEWEYVARAGTTTRRFWGDSDDGCAYANAADLTTRDKYKSSIPITSSCRDGYANTAPVGSFKPNAFGVYDILGNVWEWVKDCWYENYNDAPSDGSAKSSVFSCGTLGVSRGGSWSDGPESVRSAVRKKLAYDAGNDEIGFRVARTLSH